jgi:methyl-accepting chemotaxis protein
MKIQLRHKIIAFSICSAIIPALTLFLMVSSQQEKLINRFDEDFKLLVDKDLNNTITHLWNMCYSVNEVVQHKIYSNLRLTQQLLHEWGPIRLSDEKIVWRAENPMSKDFYFYELPKVLIGNHVIEQNFNESIASPVVDPIKALTKETVSLFQRINEEGDMLRISTTLLRADGSRDISQCLPANSKINDPDQTILRVLKGEIVLSSTNVLDEWYVYGAAPLVETESGRVMGMIRIATNEGALINLQRVFHDVAAEVNGFLWVMRGHPKKEKQGFIYPKNSEYDYLELNHIVQEKGVLFFDNLRRNAINNPVGQVLSQSFEIKDAHKQKNQAALIKCIYFPQWDWVIGILACEDNYVPIHKKLREPFIFLTQAILWAMIIGLSLVIFIAFFLGEKIARPIVDLSGVTSKMASGELNIASSLLKKAFIDNEIPDLNSHPRNETEQLFYGMGKMVDSINRLAMNIKGVLDGFVIALDELGILSKDQGHHTQQLGQFNQHIHDSIHSAMTQYEHLSEGIDELNNFNLDIHKLLGESIKQLDHIDSQVQIVLKLKNTIAYKLLILNQKAANMSSFINTIKKIGDQAEVLSINASIEAEKAGEFGKGFSVIARQISLLASQTSLAGSDIHKMLKDMSQAVNVATQDMEKFNTEVSNCTHEVSFLQHKLGSILEQEQVLIPRLNRIKKDLEDQNQKLSKTHQNSLDFDKKQKKITQCIQQTESIQTTLTQGTQAIKQELLSIKLIESDTALRRFEEPILETVDIN